MTERSAEVLRWFAQTGECYVRTNLSSSRIDIERLRSDREYGLKIFLSNWAYERSGAPRGYRIAAVKAISSTWPDLRALPAAYLRFYHGKRNEQLNPVGDPRLAQLDIPEVVAQVEQGELAAAFAGLTLRGVGPKIKAFFIRDIVTLTLSETRLDSLGNYLYCQPIDIWVRETVELLNLPAPVLPRPLSTADYGFISRDDLLAAARLTAASLQAAVSPLKVNQGIWYFCANGVADSGRLRELLSQGGASALADELALMDGFLP
jgi:hypothetical protein